MTSFLTFFLKMSYFLHRVFTGGLTYFLLGTRHDF